MVHYNLFGTKGKTRLGINKWAKAGLHLDVSFFFFKPEVGSEIIVGQN